MGHVTKHIALPFQLNEAAALVAGAPIECPSPIAAIRQAVVLSGTANYVGAVAFSQSSDPEVGDFRDVVILRKLGSVPDNLSGI